MVSITGAPVLSGDIHWHYWDGYSPYGDEEGVCLSFSFSSYHEALQRRQTLKALERVVAENNLDWIRPGREKWTINLDAFREHFAKIEDLKNLDYLSGEVAVDPEFESTQRDVFGDGKISHDASVDFYLTPDLHHTMPSHEIPVEIRDSLERFQIEHPDPKKTAFLMMQFGKTAAHEAIAASIKSAFEPLGISVVRADEKEYHDDLFPNVLTYLYGCGFGIAVFERLENEVFNPNVSLEVGYLFALKKPVCLMKDKTLQTLHTDLVGKLYRAFDPQDAKTTIPDLVVQWARDKGIIAGD